MFKVRQRPTRDDPFGGIYLGRNGELMNFDEWLERRMAYLQQRGKRVPPKSRKR